MVVIRKQTLQHHWVGSTRQVAAAQGMALLVLMLLLLLLLLLLLRLYLWLLVGEWERGSDGLLQALLRSSRPAKSKN